MISIIGMPCYLWSVRSKDKQIKLNPNYQLWILAKVCDLLINYICSCLWHNSIEPTTDFHCWIHTLKTHLKLDLLGRFLRPLYIYIKIQYKHSIRKNPTNWCKFCFKNMNQLCLNMHKPELDDWPQTTLSRCSIR